ncbi:cytochrome c oxidase subunit II [Pseudohoeflea sp. DP4N28-3]|uniref:Cytochrome c oxidase subunit II n=2 Tax=Pseudohoeflea coraliihabitans TaxID=2860393 RepID=A0ABS6WMD5_9HYPH|nr:cytochrome c oxidase subunit II [Pseudohoeflea sp. DP4N28-3]
MRPAGREAEQIAQLAWVLFIGAAILWLLVMALFVYITKQNPRPLSRRWAEALIIGGGGIFPVIVLGILLVWTLPLMPAQRMPGDGLTIRVTGKQWWWKVEYLDANGDEANTVVSANEIRLPKGRRTEIVLAADRVIHSFWIPALAGKTDMIPGQTTRMALEPTKTGTFRGVCAEFCGESHALMAFDAVVLEEPAFKAWLAAEREPADAPRTAAERRGAEVFLTQGCGACHAVRGTPAQAQIGPDLTHFGSRLTLGAGSFDNRSAERQSWVAHAAAMKPGARMPAYASLSDEDLAALDRYLEGLK